MKRVFIAMVLVGALCVSAARADEPSPGMKRVLAAYDQCVRDNAARVEQAIPNLSEALGYLTVSVCAKNLVAVQQETLNDLRAQRAAQEARFMAAQRSMQECQARLAAALPRKEGDESNSHAKGRTAECQLVLEPEDMRPYSDQLLRSSIFGEAVDPPAEIRSAAANYLLDARAARTR